MSTFEVMKNRKYSYWLLAARPRTLPASVMPVLVACSLAWKDGRFQWIPSLICILFALIAQIVSNFLNDYFDFVKGSDREDRIGPERAVAQGWISPPAMLKAAILLMTFACLLGSAAIYYAGWKIVPVGIAVCIGVFAYSAGPFPLAYRGLGDICVLIFYGIVPVVFTYYTQTQEWSMPAMICGIAMGVVTTNILVANNYRDREADRISGKYTTIVLFGEKFGRYFYLANGIAATGTCFFLIASHGYCAALLPIVYLIPHWATWKSMCKIQEGNALNHILGQSARNVIIFGILLGVGILIG